MRNSSKGQEIDRRHFLKSGGLLAGAVYAGAGTKSQAIEPILWKGPPKFRFGLAAYSYRDLLTGDDSTMTMSEFIADCARFNLDAAELTTYYFTKPECTEYLIGLKRDCFLQGLAISGIAIRSDFGRPEGQARVDELATVKSWIDRAHVLGAPTIRIFAGDQHEGTSAEESHALIVSGVEECCDYAGRYGMYLALENHGGPTSTAVGFLAILNDVKSRWLGANLDTGNFFSEDPYAELAQIAPYAVNVQVKVVTSNAEKTQKAPTDYGRIAKLLRDVGYRGYVVLEYEESGDPRRECEKVFKELREAFA